MPRKSHPDQMTFNFTAPMQPLPVAAETDGLSPFERRLRLTLKAVFDDAALDRAEIAARMSAQLGRAISKHQLDQWAALATPERRMQVDALLALCAVTADKRLLHVFAEAAGMKLLTREEAVCAEYGAKMLLNQMIKDELKGTLKGVDERKLRAQLLQRFGRKHD